MIVELKYRLIDSLGGVWPVGLAMFIDRVFAVQGGDVRLDLVDTATGRLLINVPPDFVCWSQG